MPLSLRIPSDKERMIKRAATKVRKTKTAFILEAVYEKLGLIQSREQLVREMAGWLAKEEAEALRRSVEVFSKVDEEEWL
jgi:uncharacterized protein (DUF1778 family)